MAAVFPAHAGMDRPLGHGRAGHRGVPRTRGDGPITSPRQAGAYACSPHTRGWTVGLDGQRGRLVVFPAHAGMDRSSGSRGCRCRCVPRTRGDGPKASTKLDILTRCSPHTRGWTVRDPQRHRRRGRVPRTRGDGPLKQGKVLLLVLCSPHTRGWTEGEERAGHGSTVFPAHAGMDRRACPCSRG